MHIGELRDSSLVATRLAANGRVLCASPAFVARHGVPNAAAELRDVACIALRENDGDVTMWRFARRIIVRSEWSVAADLRAGRLVRLLPDWRLPSSDVIAFVGPRRGRSVRATRFVEYSREALTPVPWRADSRIPRSERLLVSVTDQRIRESADPLPTLEEGRLHAAS